MKRLLCVLGMSIALMGCDRDTDLSQFTKADLQAALTAAQAAKDPYAPYRARCWATLLTVVPEGSVGPSLPEVKGLASAIEAGAEVVEALEAKRGRGLIPPAVTADCGWLLERAKVLGAKGAIKAFPGGGLVP